MYTCRKLRKLSFLCLLASFVCLVFSWIYEAFSFGVYSSAMLGAFLVPLLGGFLPFYLLSRKKRAAFPARAAQMWCSALAWSCTGLLVQGILEIYGTTNSLLLFYFLAAALLAVGTLLQLRKKI